MKKVLIFILTVCIGFSLIACGGTSDDSIKNSESIIETTQPPMLDETIEETLATEIIVSETEPILEYFNTDAIVNDFFNRYNAIATYAINAELIEKGNIKTKALVYTDNFSLEVINTDDSTLSIFIETSPDVEDTAMFTVFTDCIKAMTSFSDDDISNTWDSIHETGYMVNNYDFNGIIISYTPSKELSWGVNNPHIDMTITLENNS